MLERKSPFVCSVNGAKEISIENYGSLGDFSDEKIVLNCYKCKMIIEGEGLLIEYFTDVDMKITGHIHSIHFEGRSRCSFRYFIFCRDIAGLF